MQTTNEAFQAQVTAIKAQSAITAIADAIECHCTTADALDNVAQYVYDQLAAEEGFEDDAQAMYEMIKKCANRMAKLEAAIM